MDAPRFEAECTTRHGKDSANERHDKEKLKLFFFVMPEYSISSTALDLLVASARKTSVEEGQSTN